MAKTTSKASTSRPKAAGAPNAKRGLKRRKPAHAQKSAKVSSKYAPSTKGPASLSAFSRDLARQAEPKAGAQGTKPATKAKAFKGESPNYKRHYRGKPAKSNNLGEEFPMRLNRFLALRGIATRRAADEMIADGRVFLNGQMAKLGDRVMHADEAIEIYEARFRENKELRYVAYYKPRGVITHTPAKGEQDIQAVSGYPELFPLGRLDKDSEGLIILTNDGRVTERLLHPRFAHEKEYIVSVHERVTGKVRDLLLRGVESAGEKLSAKKVEILDPMTLSIILTEGKKHQVRRMLEAAELQVTRLVRVRIMNIHLGKLSSGQARELLGPGRKAFLRDLGL